VATSSDRRIDLDAPAPPAATLRRLKLSPEVGWYLATRGIPLPASPPAIRTPEPRTVKGAMFDAARVDRVLAVFHELRHTKGRLAGNPLDPDPWQIAYIIAPVFGWVHFDDTGYLVRIINNLYVEVPRKNGKSTLAGGLGLYLTCSDNEAGAEVLAAATTKEQAGFVFAPVKKLADSAPALKGKVKAGVSRITHPRSGSYFQVVASVGDAQHGGNIHGAIVDELHLHKKPDLVEAIETGTGSRSQPLVVLITTADDGKPNTIYSRKRDYVEKLARKVLQDPATYGVIWAASEKDDPFTEATHRKANPGYPISPTRRYLENAALQARNSPVEFANYQRLHLGIRTKQKSRFLLLDDWDRNAGVGLLRPRSRVLKDAEAWGGIDLASVSDLTSLCWLFPHDVQLGDREVTGYRAIWHSWAPEASLDDLDKRTAGAASLWVKEGHLVLTPGDVTDYDFIRDQVLSDLDFYDVRSIGFDPYNATHLTNELVEAGAPMVKVRQGFMTLSPPLKEVQRLLRIGRRAAPMLEHSGNPLVRWTVDNLTVAVDAAGNVKPDKANAGDKIDPISALVTAMSEALTRSEKPRSAYSEGRGVVFMGE
jgi:phage terminase large subunit-like protein